jgi:hypothetical protein
LTVVALGAGSVGDLRLVDDADQRLELGALGGEQAPLHLLEDVLDHVGDVHDVVVGRALDQDGGEARNMAPVADALEVADTELDGRVECQPQGEGPQGCGLALVGQAGDQDHASGRG